MSEGRHNGFPGSGSAHSDDESVDGALAAGLERELAAENDAMSVDESPESDFQEPSEESSEPDDDDDDDDYQLKPSKSKPRKVIQDDSSSSERSSGPRNRKSASSKSESP